MARSIGIGRGGLILTIIASAVMLIISYIYRGDFVSATDYGVCIASPDLWRFPAFLSWLMNTLMIWGVAGGLSLLNRNFNFIRTTQPIFPAVFLMLCTLNPWLTCRISSGVLLCVINLISMSLLFVSYDSRNATQNTFVVGTLMGLGTMFNYAFLPYAGLFIVLMAIMKILRVKEFFAYGLGFVGSYWIGIGLGMIPLEAFRWPPLAYHMPEGLHGTESNLLLISTGVVALAGLIAGVASGAKPYAGTSRFNSMNLCITLLGLISAILIIVNPININSYLATLYMAVACYIANFCAIWQLRHEWAVTTGVGVVAIGFFIALMIIH